MSLTHDSFYRRAAGSSLLLAVCDDGQGATVPVLLHWGADLGDLGEDDVAAIVRARTPTVPHSALDRPRWLAALPETVTGFTGTPAVEGVRAGATGPWAPRFDAWSLTHDGHTAHLRAADEESGLTVALTVGMDEDGVVMARSSLTNTGPGDYTVSALRCVLPVGPEATEVLDLTGRWTRERSPQRRPFAQGTWQRSGRHGRTGHDATLVMVAGTPSFGFRTGSVWGVHLAWSGDHVHYAERTPEGESLLGAHELLGPGELVLAPGEAYTTPWLLGSWSGEGLDPMSHRLHAWVRRSARHRPATRPVMLNTWEAAYFDHDLEKLSRLADAGAAVGVERFVLDDAWFKGRRSDYAGLGDWTVDPEVWPQGLHPLVDHVRGLGMEFGLWVEPEMVNLDSDLVREHPDGVLRGRSALPPEWRHQQVLDLQNPAAFSHIRNALGALLHEYDISYLKWDHNRDLVDTSHAGRPAVHGQTRALYALIDDLKGEHPHLEIETCASGGGRVDAGILLRTDRVWPSDTIDALERQHIQRWTTLLVPPELVGTHVGGPEAHTTGRRHRLGFRAATALLGHFGVEWDISAVPAQEREELAGWIATYKQVRDLVGSGLLVRGDHPDPALLVTGVVSRDRAEAVYVLATVASSATQTPLPVRLPGLDPDRRYAVERIGPEEGGPLVDMGQSWLGGEPLVLPGSVLGAAGVRLPVLPPESARVLRVSAI